MKILHLFTLSLLFLGLTISCKNDKKSKAKTETTQQTEQKTATAETFVIKPEATKVEWTGYKTTKKVAVKGQFTTLKFAAKSGASVAETLNNLEFSIPISSLFSNNEDRDHKLKTIFFGAMANTELIKGTLKATNTTCTAVLTMNGVTKELPLKMTITDKRRVELNGTIQLADWNALNAVKAINKACFDLHKGEDGVSKTWNEVAVTISTFLRPN